MHEHIKPKQCKHELKHCAHCDVVYCEKCKKEWKETGKQYDLWEKFKQQEWNKPAKQTIPFQPDYRLPGNGVFMCSHDSHTKG